MSTQHALQSQGNVLTIKSVQIAPLRSVFTTLKDLLKETNITFDRTGMKINTMDKMHTCFVHLNLHADKFEMYDIQVEKIIIGIDMINLFKVMSTVDTDDTLTIYIENDKYKEGRVSALSFKFENGTIKQTKTQHLTLIEADPVQLTYPSIKFSTIINFPSSDFQKIIKDQSTLSNILEINSVGNELIFKVVGLSVTSEIRRSGSDEEGKINFISKQPDSKIIQGKYSLPILNSFVKCTTLCPNTRLFLEQNCPFVVMYSVANLGELQLCLSTIDTETQYFN